MKDRWRNLTLYMGDLVRYVLREHYLLTDGMLDEATRAELRESAAFSVAVDKVSYEDMKVVYADETSARFQYLVTGLADFHEQIREALGGVYEHSFGYWRDVYAEILEARRVSLRPGISLDELTMMLAGMAQGLSLRHIGAASGKVIDHHKPALRAGQSLPDPDRRRHRPERRPSGCRSRRRANGRASPTRRGPQEAGTVPCLDRTAQAWAALSGAGVTSAGVVGSWSRAM